MEENDCITIELGVTLTEQQYAEVINSVIEFMNVRWPDFAQNRFTT